MNSGFGIDNPRTPNISLQLTCQHFVICIVLISSFVNISIDVKSEYGHLDSESGIAAMPSIKLFVYFLEK